jgi:NAD(P)H-quinone oxidoreductase subunit 4L
MTSSLATKSQSPVQAMSYALAYAIAVCFVVGAYATGNLDNFIQMIGLNSLLESWALKDYTELLAFVLIVLLGSTVALLGGQASIIMAVGTVGSFFALTLNQHPLIQYLSLAVSRNAVRVLMAIELMLNAVNINLVAFARYVDPVQVKGQLFAIFVITVAAAEAAVGLAIVLSIYRNTSTVDMERFNLLKW